jgi:hypothetical protein
MPRLLHGWKSGSERFVLGAAHVPPDLDPLLSPPPDAIPLAHPIGNWSESCAALFLIPFLLTGVGLFVLLGSWTLQKSQFDQLARAGIATQATVVDLRIVPGEDSDTHYATYEYLARLPNGAHQRHTREESVRPTLFAKLEPGATIPIKYLPTDPTLARIEGNPFTPPLLIILGFTLCWNAMIWPFTISTWGTLRTTNSNARRLAAEGQTTQATIVNRWIKPDSDGDDTYYVGYHFEAILPDGVPLRYTFGQQVSEPTYNRLTVGTPVQVRYLPANPQIVRLEER